MYVRYHSYSATEKDSRVLVEAPNHGKCHLQRVNQQNIAHIGTDDDVIFLVQKMTLNQQIRCNYTLSPTHAKF